MLMVIVSGFLVAEIFSRYYSKEIQMHSYDNGIGAKTKKDNWAQLMKVFRKVGLNDLLTDNEVHLIASAEDGAAVAFICKLYEVLTQRVVQTQVKKPTVGREPGYSKEISINKVRKALNRSDIGEDSDINTISRIAFGVVDDHERSLQEERIQDPGRFSTQSVTRVSQVIQRNLLDPDSAVPQVKVKEIQVKQLDRNITHLRAMKQMQSAAHNSSSAPNTSRLKVGGAGGVEGSEGAGVGGSMRSVSPSGNEYGGQRLDSPSSQKIVRGQMNPDNALSFLNSCLARVMSPDCHPAWSSHRDPFNNFISALDFIRSGETEGIVTDCLVEIGNSAQMLADACVVSPKQFWKVSDLFCAVLIAGPFDSSAFSAAVDSFESVGRWVVEKDPAISLPLFCDFALFKLLETIIRNSQKRQGIMRLMHAFSPRDAQAHVQCIKRLQATITDMATFIHCLTVLAINESDMDDMLLDLYLYYATIGLGMPSPKLRAGAVAMLSSFVPRAEQLIIPMLPQLATIATTEAWWEINAHLLSLCGCLLQSQQPENRTTSADYATIEAVVSIIHTILSRNRKSKSLNKWAAVSLAPGTFLGDAFCASYLDIIDQLEDSDRLHLLSLSSFVEGDKRNAQFVSLSLPSSTGTGFVLTPITLRWDPLVVAETLSSLVSNSASERLKASQVQVIHACFQSAVDNAKRNGDKLDDVLSGPWLQLYEALRNFIFIGFCDQNSAVHSAGIFSCLLYFSSLREKILQESRFIGTLRLLYPVNLDPSNSNAISCQVTMENFLRDCFGAGHPFNSTTHALLAQFEQNFPTQIGKYPTLQRMLKDFSSQLR